MTPFTLGSFKSSKVLKSVFGPTTELSNDSKLKDVPNNVTLKQMAQVNYVKYTYSY